MSKPVLLCVDDEEIILLSLKDQLREHFGHEYQLEMVDSGEEALAVFSEFLAAGVDVPVVLCDHIMPGMKGSELLRRIHALNERTCSILLTGQADAGAVGDAVNHANLFRYITKPWDETDLVLTIKEAVRGYFQDKQLEEQNRALIELNENLERLVVERTTEVVRQKEEIQRQMHDIEFQRQELQLRNDFIRGVFGRYVSDEVMDTVLRDPEGLHIGGDKKDITVLISDLRGFTAFTNRLPADTVMRVLNRYFERMIEVISEHRGIVIEFLGDGVLAIFGAPNPLPDHADRAVACALSMQLVMEGINAIHVSEGLPPIEMGIGLASGDVVVGNIGSERRAKYGVVGTPVNLAARIEALSTGQQILIDAATLERCVARVIVDHRFQVSLKGIGVPLTIHSVSGIENGTSIRFRPPELALQPVRRPIAIEFTILDGKSVSGPRYSAEVTALSIHAVRLRLAQEMPPHADVRIDAVRDGDVRTETEVYAKVIDADPETVLLRFTSVFFGEAEHRLMDMAS
ncbi:MAG: adenylate/guanylate cyclase domain-containing protein [Bacteroidota bacterium]|jgi:class 3 adenylate cyclase/DNA-binding LytR/AlgR family response regulator|nr:adenylate/guanylate cyclase domain-containing protein [Bacteroidota bacterium]